MPAVWPTIVGKERPREHWDTARLLDDRGFELDRLSIVVRPGHVLNRL
ncbi:MAG: hypothetical protein QOI16_2849 [Pseudonocardiales bacterium]|nr:hypothetical protein [Pseudonocardiales bacterium]